MSFFEAQEGAAAAVRAALSNCMIDFGDAVEHPGLLELDIQVIASDGYTMERRNSITFAKDLNRGNGEMFTVLSGQGAGRTFVLDGQELDDGFNVRYWARGA